MDKTTKNIILVVLLIILIVSSYFTINHIKNNNHIDVRDNMKMIDNNFNPSNNTQDNKEDQVIKGDEESNQSEANDITNNRENIAKGKYGKRQFDNRNNKLQNNIKFSNNSNNNIYYVLFGIESACIGAIILYLVLSNLKKKEVK